MDLRYVKILALTQGFKPNKISADVNPLKEGWSTISSNRPWSSRHHLSWGNQFQLQVLLIMLCTSIMFYVKKQLF